MRSYATNVHSDCPRWSAEQKLKSNPSLIFNRYEYWGAPGWNAEHKDERRILPWCSTDTNIEEHVIRVIVYFFQENAFNIRKRCMKINALVLRRSKKAAVLCVLQQLVINLTSKPSSHTMRTHRSFLLYMFYKEGSSSTQIAHCTCDKHRDACMVITKLFWIPLYK